MAKNRQFKPPKEEFPEDEELVAGKLAQRRGVAAVAKKGKKQSPPPEEDDPVDEYAEDSRRPAKGKKKPSKREDDEIESEKPGGKPDKRKVAAEPPGKPAKGRQKPPADDEEESPPPAKKSGKATKPYGKTKPPSDSEDAAEADSPPAKKPAGKSRKAAEKPTTDEDRQAEVVEDPSLKKGNAKGKKNASILPTERSTPRIGAQPHGRLSKRMRILGFAYVALNLLGIGAGVVALIFDWVKNSLGTMTLSKVTIDVGGISASVTIKEAFDSCPSGCEPIQYYYATSIIMLVLGALGMLCALAKGALMVLILIRSSFSKPKLLMRAVPAAAVFWVLGVAGMVVSFTKLKDQDSSLTIGVGMAIAFADVGLFAANAGLGFFVTRKMQGNSDGDEEEQVQSTRH